MGFRKGWYATSPGGWINFNFSIQILVSRIHDPQMIPTSCCSFPWEASSTLNRADVWPTGYCANGSIWIWLSDMNHKRHCTFYLAFLGYSFWRKPASTSWKHSLSTRVKYMWHRTEAFCQQVWICWPREWTNFAQILQLKLWTTGRPADILPILS